jgi:AbiV family abortive infection protein
MPWKISKADDKNGILLCRKNAQFLIRKAKDAFKKTCYHGAYLLALAALEEVGKAVMIMNHYERFSYRYTN